MSIATEITRLQTAKADLKTAIEGKGVTVPSATKIDGYADLVDAIQTGGGGSVTAATGEITLVSNFALTTTPQIFPGLQLPFVPNFFRFFMTLESWNAMDGHSSGLYDFMIDDKTIIPPRRITATETTEGLTGDNALFVSASVGTNTGATSGYTLSNGSYYPQTYSDKFYFDSDGHLYVGRYSSASTSIYAGTYRYFAFKV